MSGLSSRPPVYSIASSQELLVLGDGGQSPCIIRRDDTGIWNNFKAWYLFLLHIMMSIGLVLGILQIDDHNFGIGSGSSLLQRSHLMYQAQATALISLGLVLTRIFAGASSALLVWRIGFILLEKRGISLAELLPLIDWRRPFLPRGSSMPTLLWSVWATTAVMLLWPQVFAAPLASSSVTWIPRTRLREEILTRSVGRVTENADWGLRLYRDFQMNTIVTAAVMTGRDPSYAFDSTAKFPVRRYFAMDERIPDGSLMDIRVPWFDVTLRWIDASSDNRSSNAGKSAYEDISGGQFQARVNGTASIVRYEPWDGSQVPVGQPGKKTVEGQLVAVKAGNLDLPANTSKIGFDYTAHRCPPDSDSFGRLPDVEQHGIPMLFGDNVITYDCYIMAEATIRKGLYAAKNCTVVSAPDTSERYATCHTEHDDVLLEDDMMSDLALDFTSEVMKCSVLMNFTRPWINGDLNAYTTGMLRMGYHAAWSGLMKNMNLSQLGDPAEEPVLFRPTESVVKASVNKTSLYLWLALNGLLTLSAMLVCLAQMFCETKTIRDPTLAALTVDLTEVACNTRARGLCNAVTLDKLDKKLPRLKWKGTVRESEGEEVDARRSYRRRVVFAEEGPSRISRAPLRGHLSEG